jgi:hypothetical protein
MKAFKALLKKDFQIYKKTLLIPVWIVLALLLINGTILLAVALKSDINVVLEARELLAENSELVTSEAIQKISYFLGIGLAFSLTLLGLLVSLTAAQSALNTNRNANCEGFYRSVPVSDWVSNLSVYIVTIFGGWGVTFVIGALGVIGTFIFALLVIKLHFGMMLLGLIQFFLNFMIPSLIIASIGYFFSAIFESKAFFKMILLFLVFKYALITMDWILGIHISDPFIHIFKPIGESFIVLENLDSVFETLELNGFINKMWFSVFSVKNLFYFLINAGLFAGATYVKRLKDVR